MMERRIFSEVVRRVKSSINSALGYGLLLIQGSCRLAIAGGLRSFANKSLREQMIKAQCMKQVIKDGERASKLKKSKVHTFS